MPQTEKIPLRVINALMEYINKCGNMGHIKQNNYANYIALKSIFLNLHKKRAARHFRQTAAYYNRLAIERPTQLSLSLERLLARISRH